MAEEQVRISKPQRWDIPFGEDMTEARVVREGDYGSSAFFIVSGAVQVILDSLPAQMLGRRVSQKKNFFKSVAQLWERPPYPEVRDYSQRKVTGTATAEVRARGDEK